MDVGIDCSCVAKRERTGVARYCASLVGALPAALGPQDRVTLLYRASRFKRRKWFETVDDPRFRSAYFNDRFVRVAPRGLDVVHGPDLRIPKLSGVPAIATVHDLSALDLPGIADAKFRKHKLTALSDVARRAAVIVCISDFTRRAFLDRFPSAEPRVRIVPLGVLPTFAPQPADVVDAMRRRRGLAKPYVLFVGQVSARKNLGPVLAAFEELRARPEHADLELVLAGPVQTRGEDVVDTAKKLRAATSVRFLGFTGDDELPALYSGAAAFCFPGKGEGFGIPILEAMACGCPVVAARAGANAGTGGGAALFVDPDSAGEFASALARVLTDASLRDDLVRRGREHAAQFSWAETARRTVIAYRDAARIGAPA